MWLFYFMRRTIRVSFRRVILLCVNSPAAVPKLTHDRNCCIREKNAPNANWNKTKINSPGFLRVVYFRCADEWHVFCILRCVTFYLKIYQKVKYNWNKVYFTTTRGFVVTLPIIDSHILFKEFSVFYFYWTSTTMCIYFSYITYRKYVRKRLKKELV